MTIALRALRRTRRSLAAHLDPRDERGDVPGWVLVTLMTAGIVAVLWAVAQDRLIALFEQAINSVSP